MMKRDVAARAAQCGRLVVALLALSCDSSPADEPVCAPGPGLEVESGIAMCRIDGKCVGLAPHPSCPAAPARAEDLCALHGGGHQVSRVACGDNVLVWWSGGLSMFQCLYNPSGALIGTSGGSDSGGAYCGISSSWTWGVTIPSCATRADPNLCPAR